MEQSQIPAGAAGMNRHPRQYGSFMEFYRETYQTSIRRTHASALPDVSLIDLEQGAGDWSDAAHPELVIAQIQSPQLSLRSSFGDGVHRSCFRGLHGTVLQPPNAHISIHIDNPHRFHVLAIPYEKLLALAGADVLPADGDFGRLSDVPFTNPDLFNPVGSLRDEAEAGSPHGALFAQGGLMMLAAMLAGLRPDSVTTRERGGMAPWQLRRATEMMIGSEGANVSLAEMAAEVGLSVFHFCRAFKRASGVAPHRYQALRRLERAKGLLTDTQLPIIEIALSVGYDSPQGLARLFQRELGTSPSEWRRQRAGHLG
jgi:AraC family transcriptional regulator